MAEFEKMELASADVVGKRIARLLTLFPEVATERERESNSGAAERGVGIDFEKLRLILGDAVDEGTERYAFTWPGKADAIRQSQTPSTATLRPAPEESVNWDTTENLYIEGDNLEVLKLLQHSYHGCVKLIYIDPPYNTGHDFVYKDKFGDTIENYREQAGLSGQSNADTSGRYHSDWCSMMYPRLRLARELLADDGVIFISIDENEVRNLRIVCDEVFGEDNVLGVLTVVNNLKGRSDAEHFATAHEFALVAAKNISRFQLHGLPASPEYLAEFDHEDAISRYKEVALRKTGKNSRRQDRPNMFYPIYYSPSNNGFSLENLPGYVEVLPLDMSGNEGCWRWGKATFLENKDTELVARHRNGRWSIYVKMRDIDDKGNQRTIRPKSLWQKPSYDSGSAKHELKQLFDGVSVFDTPKPTAFLEDVLRVAGVGENGLVVDFFSGSSPLAHAVMRLNAEDGNRRKFVMVQLPEATAQGAEAYRAGFNNLCEIGKERIRRAGAKIAAEVEESNKQLRLGEEPKPVPDIGFRVLKLDESGIERPKPGELLLDVVKPGRSDEDIIFEMMLKWGLELTLPIAKVDAAGYPCYSVACGELVCCLAPGLTIEVLDAIADMEPRRVLMLDRILDDTTKLNAVQAFKRVEEKTGREVELRTV